MNELSPEMWVVIGIAGAIQITIMIIGFVVLFRTPTERLTAPRWFWALICIVQFGGLVFLLAGRKPAAAPEPTPTTTPTGDFTQRVIAELYGARK